MDNATSNNLGNPALILVTLCMVPAVYLIKQFLDWLIFTYRRNTALKQFASPPGHWLLGNIRGVSQPTHPLLNQGTGSQDKSEEYGNLLLKNPTSKHPPPPILHPDMAHGAQKR